MFRTFSHTLAAVCLLALPVAALAQAPPAAPPDTADGRPDGGPSPPALIFGDDFIPPPAAEQPAPPPAAPAAPPVDGPMAGPFGGSPMFSPVVGHVPYVATFRTTWYPDESVRGQGARFGLWQYDASVLFPIWQGERDEVSGSVRVGAEAIQTSAVLPNTKQAFPDDLWAVRFGGTYRHLFDNGWIAGAGASFGSASDQPFHSIHELTAGVNAFLRVPSGEHNAWLFTLSYSPTGELNFPIPGVAYVWVPNDEFRMNIGLPFSVSYRPTEDLTFDFAYMLLTTVHARATYRICRPVRVYAGFDWTDESYFLAGRADDLQRLFYYEKRLSVGVQAPLGRAFLLDVSTGYVFDRYYFEGRNFNDSHFNRVDVGAAPLLSAQAMLRW